MTKRRFFTSSLYIPLFCFLAALTTANNNFFSFLLNPKEELTKNTVNLASTPRISYQMQKRSKSPFWIVNLKVEEETKDIPFLLLPYTAQSFYSMCDISASNIQELTCDDSIGCIYDGSDSNPTRDLNYINYTISGKEATIQAYPDTYAVPFGIYAINNGSYPFYSPLPVVGGIGLGYDNTTSKPSFIKSFQVLDNNLAGIYLSEDDYDATSELMVGNYNPAFVDEKGTFYTINVNNSAIWSFVFDNITDEKATTYGISAMGILDPNLNFIAMPNASYTAFLNALQARNITCNATAPIFPTCTFAEDTKPDFPAFYLNFPLQVLPFPVDLYVKKGDNMYTLLIGMTSSINAQPPYNETWIFGSPFMTYYYTILNFTNPNYEIIFTKSTTFVANSKWYIIIGSLAGIVILVGIIACVTIVMGRKDKAREPLISEEEKGEEYHQPDVNIEEERKSIS